MAEERNLRKVRIGKVVSDKMTKTVVVLCERQFAHPVYKKKMKRRAKFKAHDENEFHESDKVKIMETKTFSKDICWRVVEIIERQK